WPFFESSSRSSSLLERTAVRTAAGRCGTRQTEPRKLTYILFSSAQARVSAAPVDASLADVGIHGGRTGKNEASSVCCHGCPESPKMGIHAHAALPSRAPQNPSVGGPKKPKPAWFAPYGLRRCRHIRERWPKAQAAERLLTPRAIIFRPIGTVKPWSDLIPVIHTGDRSERGDEKRRRRLNGRGADAAGGSSEPRSLIKPRQLKR